MMGEVAEQAVSEDSTLVNGPTKKSTIIRLCNLSGSVTEKMARQLLESISPLEEFVMYPKDKSIPTATKVVYARFKDPEAYKCAIHLTSSLFLDRPLIIVPMSSSEIPSEVSAINTATQLSAEEVSQLVVGGALVGSGINIALNFGFPYVPTPPELPSDYSSRRQSEIRRTIFVNNIHPDVTAEVLLTMFSGVGEVRYIRHFDDKNSPNKCALVEFTESTTVYPALQFHEFPLFDTPIGITFAITSINKDPQTYSVSTKSGRRSRSPSKKSYRSPTRKRSTSRSRRSPHRKRSRSREVSRRHRRDSGSRERPSRSRRSKSPKPERSRRRRSRSQDDEYYELKRAKKRKRTPSTSSERELDKKSRKKHKSSKSSQRKRSSSPDNTSSKHSKRHSSHKDDSSKKQRESTRKHNSPPVDWSEEERLYLESKKSD